MYEMDARGYQAEMTRGAFREVYPAVARQILARTGVARGHVIDVGGGPGMLGLAYAGVSEARVTIFDLLPDCVALARENIVAAGLAGRVDAVQGRAEAMPFATGSVDLVISRGSVYFWEDQKMGLSETWRVLKPGGWAHVGGGFGSAELLARVIAEKADAAAWLEKRKKRMANFPPARFEGYLAELGIAGAVEESPAGSWIVFQKAAG